MERHLWNRYLYLAEMKKIIFLLMLFCWTNCFAEEAALKIHFIDVGEGEAILLQHAGQNILIDTGNPLSGRRLADYLVKNGAGTINRLIITHPDDDHISGVSFLENGFGIESFYRSDCNQALGSEPKYQLLRAGENIKTNGLTLRAIWPQKCSGSLNRDSLVILLEYSGFKCLLTGDIDKAAEDELLKNTDLAAEILKVSHHGAGDATGDEFLNRVNPKYAVISVDKDNKRGYPAESTLEKLAARKIATYRTDKNGTVTFTIKDKGLSITTEK
jgi:competence protein ComEC